MSDLHLDRLLKIFMVISCITIIYCGEIQARTVTFSHIHELKINEGEKGSFSLFNTSETRILFGDHIWGITIGATWNLTIHLHSNSTSGILVSFLSLDPLWYSGIKEFGVSPGQTFSENYTQHGMSDSIPYFNFNYSLIESKNNASGTYEIKLVHTGYPCEYGTGTIYVGNITEWLLNKQSSTISSPPNNQSSTIDSSNLSTTSSIIGFSTLMGILTLILRRKKEKHKD